jgi:cell division septation protein DedD
VAHPTADDGFHEIQLNGKQLVFLFMAVTVVSVAVFLSGVLVGRGVRAEQASRIEQAALADAGDPAGPRPSPSAAPAPPPSADPTTAAPPTPVDDLSYVRRLEQPNPSPDEKLGAKGLAAKESNAAAPAAPPAKKPTQDAASKTATPSAAPAAAAQPPASAPAPAPGYAVQVAAVNARVDADAMAKRLVSKGYAAYVLQPTEEGPAVYRVRVGTFKTRGEANVLVAKLQREEKLRPFVTEIKARSTSSF